MVCPSEATGTKPGFRWAAVVFTHDAAYVPPRIEAEPRWTVKMGADGQLDEAATRMITVTMPHEQVHHYQGRVGATTPRWFQEGHAEWVGRRVTKRIAPDAESSVVRRLRAEPAPPGSLALGAWGGITPKREAILRQVSPADRRRMERELRFVPPGPFSFGPGDLVSDGRNEIARYQGAWAVFSELEKRHGADAVRDWVAGATSRPGNVSGAAIIDSARQALGEDLTDRLK